MLTTSKACTRCKEVKNASCFAPDYRLLGGLQSRCKTCKAELTRIWQKNNPDRVKQAKRESYARKVNGIPTAQQKWNAKNADKLREYGRNYQNKRRAKLRAENPALQTANNRINTLFKRGLTPESYAALLASQNGVCAICGGVNRDGRPLGVDHDHQCHPSGTFSCSKCNRGLLCVHCNAALHKMENDVGWHLKALAYLEKFRS